MISIVICTYNRSESLKRTLASLAGMSCSRDLCSEIIVVDNNSKDRTRDVVEDFARTSPFHVRYVFEATTGLAHARNRGVAAASGQVVAFIDDDVLVSHNWLTEVKKGFDQYHAVCVGGKVLLSAELRKPAWWNKSYDLVLGGFDLGDSVIVGDRSGPELVGIGANLSVRRLAFSKHGLFRIDLGRSGKRLLMGEEYEFAKRLREKGEVAVYCPSALVYHCPAMERISRQYVRRWFYRFGEWSFVRALESPRREITIFGVPRWRYRSALEDFYKSVVLCLRRQSAQALFHEIQLVFFLGYFCGSLKRFLHLGSLAQPSADGCSAPVLGLEEDRSSPAK